MTPSGGGIYIAGPAGQASLTRVTVSGNTASNTTAMTDAFGGGVHIVPGRHVVVTDSTISNNTAVSPRNGEGAGILNNGTLTLNNVAIHDNKAVTNSASNAFAGGIANYHNGVVVMNGGSLTGNCAARDLTTCMNRTATGSGEGRGGAINNSACSDEECMTLGEATVTLNGVLIDQNFAQDNGGGISNGSAGKVYINASSVVDNDAWSGGGIYNKDTDSLVSVTFSTIDGNTAVSVGGGVHNVADLEMTDSTVSNNMVTLGDGGGIESCGGASLSLRNCTVSGNSAAVHRFAGGICLTESPADLSFVTIAGNSAGTGGGIFVGVGTQPAKRLKGVIIGDNTAVTAGPDCAATAALTSLGYNLIENATGCTIAPTTGDQFGTAGTPIDPGLNALQSNGGPTETHALNAGSPAVNQVPPGSCTDTGGVAVTNDQRAFTRPAGINCDVGAYERDAVQPPATSTPTRTLTPTPTRTFTPASTPSASRTPTPTASATPAASGTPSTTPTGTPSSTPTTTATRTPQPGVVDHYRCYTAKTAKGTPKFAPVPGVHVVDPFEDVMMQVQKPRALCAPADKNAEGVNDAATHLEQYRIKLEKGQPRHIKRKNLRIENQLGTVFLDTARAEMLLIPTAKSLVSPPSPPDPAQHAVDHYACYKVKITSGTPKFPRGLEVTVGDQFTSPANRYVVRKPRLLCTPADKNGEGVRHVEHQLCYSLKLAKGRCADAAPANAGGSCKREDDCGGTQRVTDFCLEQRRFSPVKGVHVANQFGAERLDVLKEAELCVPSVRVP